MIIELQLGDDEKIDDVFELKNFIAEKNLKGLLVSVLPKKSKIGTQSGNEYFNIIEIALKSTVIASGVKGIFDVLKNLIELQKQKQTLKMQLEEKILDSKQIELVLEGKNGKKIKLKLSVADENERTMFYTTIIELLNQ